ncbi:phosphoadenosine phosphosulfate reductase, partial [Candidatus Pacearchaeota archaeon]|nr:phosphoadenosine phosphosulfate reductase [Candidatus Pacearchaeota archaeon]
MNQVTTKQIIELVEQGAIFYISHSGGKDSQTMLLLISVLVPIEQLVVIHAHLPEVEWGGTRQHIKKTIGQIQYIEVTATKTFFGMVDHRQMFPGPKYRQCTSDL